MIAASCEVESRHVVLLHPSPVAVSPADRNRPGRKVGAFLFSALAGVGRNYRPL